MCIHRIWGGEMEIRGEVRGKREARESQEVDDTEARLVLEISCLEFIRSSDCYITDPEERE